MVLLYGARTSQDKSITLNQIKPYVDALDLHNKTNSYTISLAMYLCCLNKNNSLDNQDDFVKMVYQFLELKYSNFNCKLYQALVRHLDKENPPPYAIDKLLDKYYGDDFFNGKYDEHASICKNKIDTFILKMKNIDKIMIFVIDTIKHTEEQLDLRSEFSNMTPSDFCKIELLWECFLKNYTGNVTLSQIKCYIDRLDLRNSSDSYTISLFFFHLRISSKGYYSIHLQNAINFLYENINNFNDQLYNDLMDHYVTSNIFPFQHFLDDIINQLAQ